MDKKSYISPKGEVIQCGPFLLSTISSGDRGIGYGGKDKDGTKDPAGRAYYYDEELEEDLEEEEF